MRDSVGSGENRSGENNRVIIVMNFYIKLLVLSCLSTTVLCQLRREARWCVVNKEEEKKCNDLVAAIAKRIALNRPYPPWSYEYDKLPEFKCVRGSDHFDCMEIIARGEADLIQLEPGMGYTGGEFYNMMPLLAEKYLNGTGDEGLEYWAVAVVRKDNPDITLDNLAGKKACHTGVGRAAGWVYPVSTLMEEKIMPIVECNVPVKSAAAFFGDMCAPGGLARYYNPFGNNPVTVCENCVGTGEEYCSLNDPYAGYMGAFTCMESRNGDVAFVRHSTVQQATKNSTSVPTDFELLCPDGRRAPYDTASTCNWGTIASHIVMTSAIRDKALRDQFKMLLKLIDWDFGVGGQSTDLFQLFLSVPYGKHDLMFSDVTMSLKDVEEVGDGSRNTYYTWVGEEHRRRLLVLNMCPVQQARWCVISRKEMAKCENMIMAFTAKGLKPDLNCVLGVSVRDCMDKIAFGDADLITLDAADVYVAGKYFNLVPIAAEDYSGYDDAKYYAVAVARKTSSYLTIFNLKYRRTCHSAVQTAAGWIIPIDKLIETAQIHVKGCNIYRTVGEFFSKSCIPGVLWEEYNRYNTNPINLCEACGSSGYERCQRNDLELYYGNSGAFRCLTEHGGDVAFVKHTTARENTDGRNQAEWARNRRSDDYELLCNDGTRANIDSWDVCNMGEVPSNAIVTASFKTEQERDVYWTLINYAQQFFASDSNEDFAMFSSPMPNYKDLIFQDSTVRLIKIAKERQNYEAYLGPSFIRAMERMRNIDCITAGQQRAASSSFLFIVLLIYCIWSQL